MSRLRIVTIGAALAVFVYVGVTATDTRVGALRTAVESALRADAHVDWIDCMCASSGNTFLDASAGVAILIVLLGGLPLAIFGLLIERQWAGVPAERRRYPRVPYWFLLFQIVSCSCSALVLTVFVPELLFPVGMPGSHDWAFIALMAYLTAQLIVGLAAVPIWRRFGVCQPREQILPI
jgi:hypothetical protein